MTDRNMQIVVEQALDGKLCTVLHLSKNIGIKPPGVSIIASALKTNNTLVGLYLTSNYNFSDESAKILAEGLKENHSLKTLDLSNNAIENSGAIALAGMLESNKTLINLNLSRNEISNLGINKLAQILSNINRNLEKLNIEYNTFGDESVDSIIKMLRNNQNLEHLVIGYTNITPQSRASLQQIGGKRLNS